MNRVVAKPTTSPASVEIATVGDVAVLNISGLVDERFTSFGSNLGNPASIVINVAGITRMTSFGVRQWLKAMDALPKRSAELFLLGCPTFFVDQLNMVLNFGGAAKVLTVVAPYTCTACGVESAEPIDVLAERTNLSIGAIPEKQCARCAGKLEFDESPESYFAFVNKYGAASIEPRTAAALATLGLYAAQDSVADKPPRIIKLVQDSVTYFRIIGRIGSLFRARPFLVGAEGEVVIDLQEVEAYDPAAQPEWRRLLKSLSGHVTSVTLVDVKDEFVPLMGDTLRLAKNLSLASVLVRHRCGDCGELSWETENLHSTTWPPDLADVVCSSCGAITRYALSEALLGQLGRLERTVPAASLKVIAHRSRLLAHAISDANAQASDVAGAGAASDDAILGKYKIVRRLPATSSIADTFLAKQVGIGGFEKPVVLNKIDRKQLEASGHLVEHVLEDVKSAGRLTHPNIVQVLDVGEVDGALYLATEYVHGKSLDEVIGQLHGSMALPEALHIVREIAHGLDHAFASTDMMGNQLGVVHGDLRPQNVMISYDGAVKLLGFGLGIAKVESAAEAHYLAPETVVDGIRDHQSDLFGLGVLLYTVCAGKQPFTATSTRSLVKQIRSGKFRHLPDIAGVPAELGALVDKLLCFSPPERPGRAAEVVGELTDIARRHSLESSSPAVGAMVTRMFPPERAGDSPANVRTLSQQIAMPRATSRDSAPVIARTASRDSAPVIARTASRDIAPRNRPPLNEESVTLPKAEEPAFDGSPTADVRIRRSPLPFLVVLLVLSALAAVAYFVVLPALGYTV